MKKVVALLAVVVLCFAMTYPVVAEEFVPSISEKGAPQLVALLDDEGKPAIGRVVDANGKVSYIYEDCLVITPVSQAKTSQLIPDSAEIMLLYVYEKLTDGTMSLPYEKFNANLDPDKMVIRDLFDASWLCSVHPGEVAPKGIMVEFTFDLNIAPGEDVYVMSYKNDAWNPIVKATNNGDGTVTCLFEDFCPIAFSVGQSTLVPPSQTGDTADITLWVILLAVSAAGLAAVLIFRKKIIQ